MDYTQTPENGKPRRRLTDILNNGNGTSLTEAWDRTVPAQDFQPLPAGTYSARVVAAELFNAQSGTPGYKLAFKVLDGEHAGRHFWHDIWLTPPALPMAKRDLGKLGITHIEQLEQPLPLGIRCQVKLALRREDDGAEYNRVRRFDVVGIDADPCADADFAPTTETAEGGAQQ